MRSSWSLDLLLNYFSFILRNAATTPVKLGLNFERNSMQYLKDNIELETTIINQNSTNGTEKKIVGDKSSGKNISICKGKDGIQKWYLVQTCSNVSNFIIFWKHILMIVLHLENQRSLFSNYYHVLSPTYWVLYGIFAFIVKSFDIF